MRSNSETVNKITIEITEAQLRVLINCLQIAWRHTAYGDSTREVASLRAAIENQLTEEQIKNSEKPILELFENK